MEVFGINDLALVLFDCINNENSKDMIQVSNEAEYRKVMNDLMDAHEYAPFEGLQSFVFEEGLITFDNGSTLWFSHSGKDDNDKSKEKKPKKEQKREEPAESLDEFLGKFNVKS